MGKSRPDAEFLEMKRKLAKLEGESQVRAAIRAHCIAFWSGVLTTAGLIGAWLDANSPAVSAGFNAFWQVGGQK
jgi:hypothetical protein